MNRYCFTIRVRPDRLDEYRRRHDRVWPEMLHALRETGWTNYSLFLNDEGLLIGYVESDDIHASLARMAETEINQRWQLEMSPFFASIDGAPDDNFTFIPEVFHLEDQIAALGLSGQEDSQQ